ncbi:MAG: DNA recombination/repair protein RecA, partial [Methanomicrobia archaeon]|nr:DNA recombination/repair protein RecA [Methanomicrobia archaeon]
MAKKEASGQAFSFDDLNKVMNKFSEYGSTMEDSVYSQIDEYINSGNYMLNCALSGILMDGGYPRNRAIELAAPSSTGKTFLMLNAAANAQKQGYVVIWYDSENAIDRNTCINFGI